MAGVLSRAAGRFASTTSSANIKLAVVSRTALAANPASPIPRLIHTEIAPPPPRFPHWFREELKMLVKEAVDAEVKGMRATCLDRYEKISSKVITLSELSATRHGECMTMHIRTQERIAQISFRVCVTMVGLAAASQYQDEIRKILLKIVDGGAGGEPASHQKVEMTVQEVSNAVKEVANAVKELEQKVGKQE